jgi:hypothetical protein
MKQSSPNGLPSSAWVLGYQTSRNAVRIKDPSAIDRSRLGDDPVFPERSVDAAILRWLAEVGHRVEIDHVNIRRRLVDEGYLTRSRDGRQYRRTERAIPVPDSRDIIHQALEDRETEARRQAAAKRHPLGPR